MTWLNRRLLWQQQNPDRGLTFAPMDLHRVKLFIFADASFANNRDLSSQMGFVVVLAEDDASEDENGYAFMMTGNILH